MSLLSFLKPKICSTFSHLIRKYSLYHKHIISMHFQKKKPFVSFSNCRNSSSGNVMLTDEKVTDFDEDLQQLNDAYEMVKKATLHTKDKALADVVKWNAKFHGFINCLDDIMDQSSLRRGKPCWYKTPNVGFIAINDCFLLESCIYKVLETYFKNTDVYSNLVQQFLKETRSTIYGQALDMLYTPADMRPRFENFNMEKYKSVAQNKSSSFYRLPVHLAMHFIGNFSENDFESTKNIWLKVALLYQLQENYGMDDKDSESKVMKLYNELGLIEKFYECEQALTSEISAMIMSLQRKSLQELLNLLLNLYIRKN